MLSEIKQMEKDKNQRFSVISGIYNKKQQISKPTNEHPKLTGTGNRRWLPEERGNREA